MEFSHHHFNACVENDEKKRASGELHHFKYGQIMLLYQGSQMDKQNLKKESVPEGEHFQ